MSNYLDKVRSTYYFRRAVPGELRPFIRTSSGAARTEWKFSLGTKDRETAKRLVPAHTLSTDAEIDAARKARAKRAYAAPEKPAQALSPLAEARAARRWENLLAGAEVETRAVADKEHRREDVAGLIQFIERRLRGSTAQMPRALRAFRYILDAGEFDRDTLKDRLLIAKTLAPKVVNAAEAVDENTDATSIGNEGKPDGGMMLDTDIVDRWAAERKVTRKTKDANAAAARWFYKHAGRIPVDKITRRDVLSFKDALIAGGQSVANTNTKISRIAALLQWAMDNELAAANVAKGITIKDVDRARNKRREFDLVSLNAIFGSPV